MALDIQKIRDDFPILSRKVYGKPLVYFDNGATTQKPIQVIDFIRDFYLNENSSIHRGVHYLSEQATLQYEQARETARKFINAYSSDEIVFTSGTTASINLVASSYGERNVGEGDEILISALEHHANIVPWQILCDKKKARLKIIPINATGEIELEQVKQLINEKTRIIAINHVSNVLGTVNDVNQVIKLAHQHDIPVLVDGAQAVQHQKVDVQKLGADFYTFSGHKIYGPTGIGVLYGRRELLDEMPPYQGGGDMVDRVSFEKTTYNELPFKFEAGTTNYVGAIGLAKAIDYVCSIGLDEIARYEDELLQYGNEKLGSIDGLKIYGTAAKKTAIFSFLLENIHQYDAGMILDKMGLALRTGTHCAQPLMNYFNIEGTLRASLCFYNTKEEIDILHQALLKVKNMLS